MRLPPRIDISSSCRYDSQARVGDKGVEYEFEIKMPVLDIEISDHEFENDARVAFKRLAAQLQSRYSWIGEVYQTGRSGGWMAFKDTRGLATPAKLRTIVGLVEEAKKKFAWQLLIDYPRR